MKPNWKEQEEVELDDVLVAETKEQEPLTLLIYDDPISTFQTVIESCIKYCKHSPEQAEQVAWIVHTKGKCDVKHGSVKELRPILEALLDMKLSAVIE